MTRNQQRIRTLIVDDEAPSRATLRRLLGRDPDIEIVGETWGNGAPEVIRRTAPDLMLLDVQMPGMSGFALIEKLPPEAMPLTVFVTAFSEYAVSAFDVRAIDYVLKPFKDERLRAALERAKHAIRSGDAQSRRMQVSKLVRQRPVSPGGATEEVDEVAGGGRADRLVLRDGGRVYLIDHADIDWIEAVGSYVRIHTGESSRLVRATLSGLEDRLGDRGFFRVHRSAMVNVDRVTEARHESHGDYLLILADGMRLRLSRTRREAFEAAIGLPTET